MMTPAYFIIDFEPVSFLIDIYKGYFREEEVQQQEEEVLPWIEYPQVLSKVYGLVVDYAWLEALFVMFLFFVYLMNNVRILRKVVYRFRGFYVGEALINGSEFTKAEIPRFQIEVYRGNLYGTTFIGYAIRVAEGTIAMPLHVYRQAIPDLFIGKDGLYFDITKAPMLESDSVTDLCYLTVQPQIFAQMKATIAKFPRDLVEGFVSVIGRSGASQGTLEKAASKGILVYGGSTKPGYSGAAYLIGSQTYGMHIGHSSGSNVGISHVVIQYDLQKFKHHIVVNKEGSVTFSSPSMMGAYEEELTKDTKGKTWDSRMFTKTHQMSKDYWAAHNDNLARNDLWADDLESAIQSMPHDVLKYLASRTAAELQKAELKVNGQSDEEVPVELFVNTPDQQASLAQRISNLEIRVSNLEKRKNVKEGPVNMITVFKCPSCDHTAATRLAVAMHMVTKHKVQEEDLDIRTIFSVQKEVKPEGVLSSDESDLVGNGKVFQNRSLSPTKRFNNYKNFSPPSNRRGPYQPSGRNQKSMESLMKSLNESLKAFAQNLPGPSSAQGQK